MTIRIRFAAAAALLTVVALPLRAQQAAIVSAASVVTPAAAPVADSVIPVRTAAIVVKAERVDDRAHVLRMERGNRFLANELRKYDARVAKLETHLVALKEKAAKREAEIGSINAQREAARVERAKLEARLSVLEQASTPKTEPVAGRGGE